MSEQTTLDYGPLTGLIGTWQGDKGMDVAPEPEGSEHNPYFETITFEAIGSVTNAETQELVALHYRQIVSRKSNGEVFHDETGYWMWDRQSGTVMHSLTIPGGVCLLAGGRYDEAASGSGPIVITLNASEDSEDWSIAQSPFMRDNAKTTSFRHVIKLDGDKLEYKETTMVEIYGKMFEHTDENTLTRVK